MFSHQRLDVISKLILDLGKILFAAAVVGFFIPGFSGTVSVPTLIAGTILSTSLFITGIKLTR